MELSTAEMRRYSRHLILPDFGLAGQKKLKAARVLIIGAGGLGSPVSLYLAATGLGTLGLVDYDRVDETNLQRQIAHGTASVGQLKVESARARLLDINPLLLSRSLGSLVKTVAQPAAVQPYHCMMGQGPAENDINR